MTGHEYLEMRRARRVKAAQHIRDWRNHAVQSGLSLTRCRELFRKLARVQDTDSPVDAAQIIARYLLTDGLGGYPPKPTRAALYREARELLHFSRTDWHNPHSTEWYSACGYDDYQSDMRWHARLEAIETFAAFKVITQEVQS